KTLRKARTTGRRTGRWAGRPFPRGGTACARSWLVAFRPGGRPGLVGCRLALVVGGRGIAWRPAPQFVDLPLCGRPPVIFPVNGPRQLAETVSGAPVPPVVLDRALELRQRRMGLPEFGDQPGQRRGLLQRTGAHGSQPGQLRGGAVRS